MQYKLKVYCRGCAQYIGEVDADTATMPDELQEKINKEVLHHRPHCSVYGGQVTSS